MTDHVIAEEGDIPPGERFIIQLEGKEIAVFRKDDQYHAFLNWCPHQGGPACEGTVTGTQESTFDRDTLGLTIQWTREDEVLNCPWHGWEFDITSGECLSRPNVKLPSYPVKVQDGEIIVSI